MPADWSIFLKLAIGFAALEICDVTRYHVRGCDGPRLLFLSGIAGMVVFLSAGLAAGLLEAVWGPGPPWLRGAADPATRATLVSFALLGILALVQMPFQNQSAALVARSSGPLFQLLHDAWQRGELIALSLQDRKFYVGYILTRHLPSRTGGGTHLRMLPVLSGYRDPATLEFKPTTDYAPLIHGWYQTPEGESLASTGRLELAIRLDMVVSARIFDPAIAADVFNVPAMRGPA